MPAVVDLRPVVSGCPADQEPPSYEVLAALVVSLRGELARAQERIAELRTAEADVTEFLRSAVG